jgi:DNA repair exonuclease SbcCD nuclease subunit
MKIVHMADSHLGFTSFGRVDKNGCNLVEEMIYKGFEQAVDEIIKLKPDAVVHAGDVFHHVRPRIKPMYIFKRCLERLRDEGIPVVIISGNHDAPKGFTATSPFYIYEGTKNISIAHKYRYERFETGDHAFHCIPFCLDPTDYATEFRKIERSGRDVLVMHGLVEALRNNRLRTVAEHELGDSLLKRDFDYIALGHYHSQLQISENAWYSGSIEYFNFGEAADAKGMLLVDLETGSAKPIEVRPRYMIDHKAVDCAGLSSEEIAEKLIELCDKDEIGDKMVRINLKNVNRAAYRNLDQARLNRLGAPAICLQIRKEFADEMEQRDDKIDRFRLHEEFERFMEDEASRDLIPRAIKSDVISYGTDLIKKAVSARNTETLGAPE